MTGTWKRLATGLAAVLTLAAPSQALADWGFTRWHMTSGQVIDASRGKLEAASGDRVNGYDLAAAGQARQDGFDFRSEFYFGGPDQGLRIVRLVLTDFSKCDALLAVLTRRLGPPHDDGLDLAVPGGPLRIRIHEWTRGDSGDYTALTSFPGYGEAPPACFVRYRPAGDVDGPPPPAPAI